MDFFKNPLLCMLYCAVYNSRLLSALPTKIHKYYHLVTGLWINSYFKYNHQTGQTCDLMIGPACLLENLNFHIIWVWPIFSEKNTVTVDCKFIWGMQSTRSQVQWRPQPETEKRHFFLLNKSVHCLSISCGKNDGWMENIIIYQIRADRQCKLSYHSSLNSIR